MTEPCEINVLSQEKAVAGRDAPKPARTVLEIVITEGKNRQIRRMCTAVGLEVSRLKRTSVGGVKLGMLKPGEYADLNEKELKLLGQAVSKYKNKRKK
jgi:23S rRNA pseudouridine2605 synthase